jgi:hypothetical protein
MSKTTIDYLTEDPVLSGQKFVCLSFILPENLKKQDGSSYDVRGIKVRGVFDSMEEAQKRCEIIRKFDSNFHVFVGEVGKWLPWNDNPENAKDEDYANKELNKLMKDYLSEQNKAKEYHELRKQDMVAKALKDLEERKKKNTEVNETSNKKVAKKKQNNLTNDKLDLLDKLDKTNDESLNKTNDDLNKQKDELNNAKQIIQDTDDEVKKLKEEMLRLQLELEEENKK